ncbi:hypothetical protein FAF44_30800 [Nonomuraea sp. MG754425]|uniref:hypothetical protein n=1 Tax=Nonomuraea sp. MG754425 TaxID=2570319 RepID=UPI001F1E5A56|nr:hypothetical protein [Nonomuraea sp. MG754425]MCF6472754.1 hypothetical protein [Nonomuraea sp. MG754425]
MRKLSAVVAVCSGVLALGLSATPAQAVPGDCSHGITDGAVDLAWGRCMTGTGTQRVVVDCRSDIDDPATEVRYYGAFVGVRELSKRACPQDRPFAAWTTVWPRN